MCLPMPKDVSGELLLTILTSQWQFKPNKRPSMVRQGFYYHSYQGQSFRTARTPLHEKLNAALKISSTSLKRWVFNQDLFNRNRSC